MAKILTEKEQLRRERIKNAQLLAELYELRDAFLEYVLEGEEDGEDVSVPDK